jgi:hypothetical protein
MINTKEKVNNKQKEKFQQHIQRLNKIIDYLNNE